MAGPRLEVGAVHLGLLAALLMNVHAQQNSPVTVIARDGQTLADAIAQMGVTKVDTTIIIPVGFISLRGVKTLTENYTDSNRGVLYATGKLIIQGLLNGTEPGTILDAAMQSFLVPSGSNRYNYEVHNLIIINICESGASLPEKSSSGAVTPTSLRLFRVNSQQSRLLSNIIMYSRQVALITISHQSTMLRSVIPEVVSIAADFLQVSGTVIVPGTIFTPWSQEAAVYNDTYSVMKRMVTRSLDNPSDPLLQQLKAQGLIMTPQYCDGDQLAPNFLSMSVDPFTGPLWVALDQQQLLTGLNDSTWDYRTRVILNLPRVLALGANLTAPATGSYPVKDFRYMLASNTSDSRRTSFNLNQRVGLFDVAAGNEFYVQWLILTGLAAQVPTQLPQSLQATDRSSLVPSVFPLAAFKTANGSESWNVRPPLVLAESALELPPNEYVAFLLLATNPGLTNLPAGLDPSIVQLATQLKQGTTKLTSSLSTDFPSRTFEQHVSQTNELLLGSLTGWGVNATSLRLVPSSPVSLASVMSSASASSTSTSKDGLSSGQIIGLAVGIPAGVLALIALLALWLRQRKHSDHTSSEGSPSKPASKAGSTIASAVKSVSSPVGAAPGPNSSSTISVGSSLRTAVESAARSQQRVFEVPSDQDASSARHSKAAEEQTMMKQVESLAAKLQQDGDKLSLVGVLGAGSGGTVYMGTWRGMQVAVKTITFPYLDKDMLPQQAVMETAISASVGHRNLVATYHYDIKALKTHHDAGQNPAGRVVIDMDAASKQAEQTAYKLFLVQELCTMSLASAMSHGLFSHGNKAGPIDLTAVLSVMVDVVTGVEYLHNKNIIHGDLKPENILLKADAGCAEGVVAKLTDFGLSSPLPVGVTHVSNFSAGTPFYVAPEVITSQRVSPASDMYSFGVTLWEVFTQLQPYVKAADGSLSWNPVFPNYLPNRAPPPALHELANRCLQHDPRLRPSATEVAAVLQDLYLDQVELNA